MLLRRQTGVLPHGFFFLHRPAAESFTVLHVFLYQSNDGAGMWWRVGRWCERRLGDLLSSPWLNRSLLGGVKVAVAALDFHVCECPGERADTHWTSSQLLPKKNNELAADSLRSSAPKQVSLHVGKSDLLKKGRLARENPDSLKSSAPKQVNPCVGIDTDLSCGLSVCQSVTYSWIRRLYDYTITSIATTTKLQLLQLQLKHNCNVGGVGGVECSEACNSWGC